MYEHPERKRRTTAGAGAADGKTGLFGREHSRERGVGQYPLLRMISGARYSGVPQSVHVLTVGSIRLAKPKSVTCQRRVRVASCAAYSHGLDWPQIAGMPRTAAQVNEASERSVLRCGAGRGWTLT